VIGGLRWRPPGQPKNRPVRAVVSQVEFLPKRCAERPPSVDFGLLRVQDPIFLPRSRTSDFDPKWILKPLLGETPERRIAL
jgi:hypothetical protein